MNGGSPTSRRRSGARHRRHHPARIRPRLLPRALVPDAALRPFTTTATATCPRARCGRTASRSNAASRAPARRADRAPRRAAAGAGRPPALVQHFGTEAVAEVTGRQRRLVRRRGGDGIDRWRSRPVRRAPTLPRRRRSRTTQSASWCFSRRPAAPGAATTADKAAKNQRLRVHYLLSRAGRPTPRSRGSAARTVTHQAQPPLFRPVTTNVKAEKRFPSRPSPARLDTLGAITRGQRQTGGQGLFRPEDNLESSYAQAALRQLYGQIHAGRVEGCTLEAFCAATGLASPTATAPCARSCRRSPPSSTGCWPCRSPCRTRCSTPSRRC